MDTYGKRLDAVLTVRERDRKWFCERMKISEQALSQVISNRPKAFTAANHENAVRLLTCNGYWLATGEGGMDDDSMWPYTLFNRVDYMEIPEAEREANEELLAGRIARLRQSKAA